MSPRIVITGEVGTRRGSYNTKVLDPKEIQSWWDLLKPRFKGKLGTFDPLIPGGGGETFDFFYASPALGPQFITRLLTETDILVTRNLEQETAGSHRKDHLYIGSGHPSQKPRSKGFRSIFCRTLSKRGKSWRWLLLYGAFSRAGVSKRSASLFNWVLSRDGQIAWQKYSATNSLRIDIPKRQSPVLGGSRRRVSITLMLDASENQDPANIKAMEKIAAEALKKMQR